MKQKIYRNEQGDIINIGEWAEDAAIPSGAYACEAETVIAPDGGCYASEDYEALRRVAYGSWQEQLDLMFHDSQDGGRRWRDHIAAVKSAYAKPQ